jgi:membrane associated rhomboid family serine protease
VEWADTAEALPDDLPSPPLDEYVAWNWSLVLKATRVPHRLERIHRGWRILAPRARLEDAVSQIVSYERENSDPAAPTPRESPGFDTGWTTLLVIAVGALFHAVSSNQVDAFGLLAPPWTDLGLADAGLIRRGEWWRCVTALTLHSDPAHFFSNAVIGGVFMYVFSRDLRSGPAWLLFIASGTAGNFMNAWVHGQGHRSLGASTAVFGAVAALTAFRAVEKHGYALRHTLAPAAAGLAILAFLGTGGERTDLLAHFFGFLAGLPLGAFAAVLVKTHGPPDNALNAITGFLALLFPVYAWSKALQSFESVPFSLW